MTKQGQLVRINNWEEMPAGGGGGGGGNASEETLEEARALLAGESALIGGNPNPALVGLKEASDYWLGDQANKFMKLIAGYAAATPPTSVPPGQIVPAWLDPSGRQFVSGLARTPAVVTPTVTNGAYAARDVFGGRITITGIYPDVGTGPNGGRTLTLSELSVSLGAALTLGVVVCTRVPTNTIADNGAFVFEPSRQLALRQLSAPVQVSASVWTCYLEAPIAVTQDTAETTSNLYLYLVALDGGNHAGTTASVRAGGFLD